MNITLREVEPTDENGQLIMEWRNNKHTRKMCYNHELKVWHIFKKEFYEKYFNNYIKPVFAYLDNKKVGFVGFIGNSIFDLETNETICKIGINLAPEYRGNKLGEIIINKSLEYIKNNYPLTKIIIAEIKPSNIASIKLFQRCKYKFIGEKKWQDLVILIYHYEI